MKYFPHFKPASDYTRYCFDKHGIKPFKAAYECQARCNGFAPVDLTIIAHDAGGYSFAHGAVITSETFKRREDAARAAFVWYGANLPLFKLSRDFA